MKRFSVWLFLALLFLMACTACSSGYTGPEPTSLRVTRVDQVSHSQAAVRVWTLTDAHAVQRLFDEIQTLPEHHNQGADTCARAHYSYTLAFFVGTKSLQQDELYTYCFTLTLPDGSQHDPSATFDSLFSGMVHLTRTQVIGW